MEHYGDHARRDGEERDWSFVSVFFFLNYGSIREDKEIRFGLSGSVSGYVLVNVFRSHSVES